MVEWYHPKYGTPPCSGGNLPMELWCDCPRQSIDFDSLRGAPPPGPQGRNRGTFVSATAKPETSVIPTAASAEWRNPPRWTKNHHKIKLATWEDSSTPLGLTCRGVVPFNQTGYIRYGASPRRGWMALGQRRYIVPCMGWYHSTAQVVFDTWRAAGCRPYGNVPRFLHFMGAKRL